MIEDLVNQAPFDTFGRWLAERGSEWEGALVPVVQTGSSASQQVGSSTHCAALPPLLAYRHSPMGRDEARARVVCFCTTSGKGPRFTCTLDFSSAPFGGHIVQPLYYRLVEALGRPGVALLRRHHHIGDWSSSRGSGQWAFGQLNNMRWARRLLMPISSASDFLGLSHDVSQALSHGLVGFWPRADIAACIRTVESACPFQEPAWILVS